jgi:hypothetical protein
MTRDKQSKPVSSDETNAQASGVWRSGNTLVMHKHALLPDRCIKCNSPAHGSHLKRKLSWHNPALALFAFMGLLPYLIAVLIASKSAKVDIGLCQTHTKRRRTAIFVSWGLLLLGVGGVILGIGEEDIVYGFIGAALVLMSIVYAAVGAQLVTVSRIDDNYIWLKRINKDYLAQLPELVKQH